MKAVPVQYGQTLIDIALQELGDSDRLFELATLNKKSVTSALTPGEMLLVPDFEPIRKSVVNLLAGNKPASLTGAPVAGYWNFSQTLAVAEAAAMAASVKVMAGQCFIDIAMQELGDADRAYELANLNGKSITDTLVPGEAILIPALEASRASVVKVLSGNKPASSTGAPVVGYWNFSHANIEAETFVPAGHSLVKALANQALIDIAIQELGDADRLQELALLNNKSITDHLTAGEYILVPAVEAAQVATVRIFTYPLNKPASELTVSGGIDFWGIEFDFIIT